MKIRYETTIDHIVAFNRFHYENSRMWRRQRLIVCLLLPAGLGIIVLLSFGRIDPEFQAEDQLFCYFLAVIAVSMSIAWFILVRWRMSANIATFTRKLLAEDSNRSLIGWREMELTHNRLLMQTELIQSSIDLRAIIKIVGNRNYTFIYISSLQAFTIPMQLYPEDEYRSFVAELREAWENREAPRPVEPPSPTRRQPDERIVERPR